MASGFDAGVGDGDAGNEGVCVGVLGVAVEVGAGCDFDDASEVHYCDAVADVSDDGEVVGDEEVGESEFGLEVCEEGEDLGLDRYVECGYWFVADNEVGLDG